MIRHFFVNRFVISLVAVLLGMGILTGALSPAFRKPENLGNLMSQAVPLCFTALGQTFALLVGGVDLSVGGLMSTITAIGAHLINASSGTKEVLQWLICSIILSILFGAVNGTLIAHLGLQPLITTLCTGIVGQGIALALVRRPSGYIPRSVVKFLAYEKGLLRLPVIYLLISFILVLFYLGYTRPGRHIYAVGGNKRAAMVAGIPVSSVVMKAYILASLFSGIGGVFLTCRLGCGDPTVGNPFTLDSVIAVLLGGMSFAGGEGTPVGSMLGGLLLVVIGNALNMVGISPFYQYIVKGVIFLTAVAIHGRQRRHS